MRPSIGVLGELLALAVVLVIGKLVPGGIFFVLYVLVAELLATYLIHCPAHYVVGNVLGIRFTGMKLGRTTLAKAIPRLSGLSRVLPVLTLTADRPSLARAGGSRASAMFASGVVASVLAPFAIAVWVSPGAMLNVLIVAWGVAFAYLLFDLVFSPRTGDIMRARKARMIKP